MTELTKLVLGMLDKAKLVLESGQQLMPIFLLKAEGEGESRIVGMPWQDAFEKEIMLSALRDHLKNPKFNCYVSVTEVWMSRDTSGTRPSEATDRTETVVVNGVARDGEQVTYFVPIEILEGGSRRLGNPELQDSKSLSGHFNNLFKDE